MKTLITITTILLTIASTSSAQAPSNVRVLFRLESLSAITIEGMSTVNSFSCTSKFIQGYGNLSGDPTTPEYSEVSAEVAAQVKLFDCGNSRMNKDLWKALQSDQHPLIMYTLDTASVSLPSDGRNEEIDVSASGTLTIAGTERPVELQLKAVQLSENLYSAIGTHEILMSDFNVEPPKALFGLIKARDRITIHFDLKTRLTTLQLMQN